MSHCPEGIERADRMVRFLREIARSLQLPQEGKDDERALDELRALVQRGCRPVPWEFGEKWCQSANAVAAQLGLVPLTPIDLERVGQGLIVHPGMLAHPRVIATLLNRLSRGERQRLRNLWPRTSWPRSHTPRPRVGGSQYRAPSVRQVSSQPSGSGECSEVVGEDWESQYVEASGAYSEGAGGDNDPGHLEVIDAHWHPTRMSVPVNLSALTVAIEQLPSGMDVPVRVVGGCAVYVDGPTPSPTDPPQPGWVTAVGLHPTKVSGVSSGCVEELMETCVKYGWAVGEVGLDYCQGTNWGHQRWVLGEVLRVVTPLTPLVLHLRGAPSDPLGQEPMLDCQSLLTQHRTPAWVPLYLHSFTGGSSQVDEWVATGRVVFFGVSGLLCFFTQEQIQGIRRIPADRLLLETDSPHLRVGPPGDDSGANRCNVSARLTSISWWPK